MNSLVGMEQLAVTGSRDLAESISVVIFLLYFLLSSFIRLLLGLMKHWLSFSILGCCVGSLDILIKAKDSQGDGKLSEVVEQVKPQPGTYFFTWWPLSRQIQALSKCSLLCAEASHVRPCSINTCCSCVFVQCDNTTRVKGLVWPCW